MGYHENLINEAETMTSEELKKLNTKHLLSIHNAVRAVMSMMTFSFIDAKPVDGDWVILNNHKKLLKAELATREHVPNKAEAKEIRRQKAKQKR